MGTRVRAESPTVRTFGTENAASWPIFEFKQHGQHEAQERHLILFTLLTPP
jgi:hypothetical protein